MFFAAKLLIHIALDAHFVLLTVVRGAGKASATADSLLVRGLCELLSYLIVRR